MSSAEEWDFTVPDDDAGLLEVFRRHGVGPGRRVHVAVSSRDGDGGLAAEELPAFIGSFSGAPDLAERSAEILLAEFPPGR